MVGSKKGKRVRRSAGEWRALLSKFAGSGLDVKAFCRREGISAARFYRWRGALSAPKDRGGRVGHHLAPRFVDLGALNSIASPRSRLDLKLDLGDGLILHLVKS